MAGSRGGSELHRRGDGGQWQGHKESHNTYFQWGRNGWQKGRELQKGFVDFGVRIIQPLKHINMAVATVYPRPYAYASCSPRRRPAELPRGFKRPLEAATPPHVQSAQQMRVILGVFDAKSMRLFLRLPCLVCLFVCVGESYGSSSLLQIDDDDNN